MRRSFRFPLAVGAWMTGLVVAASGPLMAQTERRLPDESPGRYAARPGDAGVRPARPVQPDQPVDPQYPTIERRVGSPDNGPAAPPSQDSRGIVFPPRMTLPIAGPPAARPSPVPFVLSPPEQAALDRALADWENRNKEVKAFECNFTRWVYDGVFGNGNQAKTIDQGIIKYASPDKGLFRIDGERPEQWICDGMAIHEYKYNEKTVVEYRLPPELQGKAISDGPLPFVFGTESLKLKQRYFLRLVTPANTAGEIWLEAYPRYQRDAAEFKKAELILKTPGMSPFALRTYSPNGKDSTVYQFDNVVVNRAYGWLQGNPFRAPAPLGWKKRVEESPSPQPPQQATRPPAAARR